MVFEFSAMFPTVGIDAITAAVLSENGDADRVLTHVLRERNAQATDSRRAEPAQVTQVAQLLTRRELELLEMASGEADENDNANTNNNNDDDVATPSLSEASDAELIRANQLKYRQFEAVVRQLADSFPHVPLDDVWTAVITHKGSHIEAADHLLRFVEPVTPISVPLADRRELAPTILPEPSQSQEQKLLLQQQQIQQQSALRESLDAARDDAVVVNGANIPLASSSDAGVVLPPDEALARALQDEEEAAASAAIMERILRDEQRFR
jgi:hypothetical protein